jgi:hypothetical protein
VGNLYIADTYNNVVREATSPAGGAGTVQVVVGTSPVGLTFSVDGTAYTSAQTLTWTIGDTHTIATTSQQYGTGTQYSFSGWSDGGAGSHTVVAASTASYTATFGLAYLLTMAASPAGGGTVSPATGTYFSAGTVVPLSATAGKGFAFTGWTGGVASPSSATTTIKMNAPETVTGNFVPSGAAAVWIVNGTGGLSELSATGMAVTSLPYTGGNTAIGIDATGNLWTLNTGSPLVYKTNQLGKGEATLPAGMGGLSAPKSVAVDGNGQVWVTNAGNNSVSAFTNAGTVESPGAGYTGGAMPAPAGIAVDLAGSVWIANKGNNSMTRILGAAAPVAPIATSVANNTTGAKP